MDPSFDPYLNWLGIRTPNRPPNHYQLLGIQQFESDPDVIETAADRQMAHVRTFQNGPHATASQQILNELAAAKVCLLHEQRKAKYDATLSPAASSPPPPRPAENQPSSDDADAIHLDTDEPIVRLNSPRRGNRNRKTTSLVLGIISAVLALVLAGIYLRPYIAKSMTEQQRKVTKVDHSADVDGSPNDADDSAAAIADEELPTPDAENSAAETSGSGLGNVGEVNVPVDPETRKAAPWENVRARIAPTLGLSATQPYEAALLGLSARDIDTARSTFDAAVAETPEHDRRLAVQMVLEQSEMFWRAIEDAVGAARPQAEFLFRLEPVMVAAVNSNSLVLRAANGQEKTFSLVRTDLDVDLAIALVLHRYKNAQPTAWRLIGTFLFLDQHGDQAEGLGFWRKAEEQGQQVEILRMAFREPPTPTTNLLAGNPSRAPNRSPSTATETPTDANNATDNTSSVDKGDVADAGASDSQVEQTDRLAEPDRKAVTEVRRALRKENADDYRSPEGRLALAERFLTQEEAETDAARRYALLLESIGAARSVGNMPLAMRAIDVMAGSFQIDAWKQKKSVLATVARRKSVYGDPLENIRQVVKLSEASLAEGEFDQAEQFYDVAFNMARTLDNAEPVRREIKVRKRSVVEIREAYVPLQDLKLTDDADADVQLRWGEFYALYLGDFTQGMACLAKGSDKRYQELAVLENLGGTSAQKQAEIADKWYALAEALTGVRKDNAARRAARWYQQALDQPEDFSKEAVQQMQDRASEGRSLLDSRPKVIDFSQKGAVRIPGATYAGQFPIVVEAIVRLNADGELPNLQTVVANGCRSAGVGLFAFENRWQFFVHNGSSFARAFSNVPIVRDRWYHVAGMFDGQNVVLFVNGQRQTATRTVQRHNPSEFPFFVGASPRSAETPEYFLNGQIQAIQISAMNEVGFQNVMRSGGLASVTNQTVVSLRFDTGFGSHFEDQTANGYDGVGQQIRWVER
ncbi:MAG: LamG domain-containing protein [Pirellulaceae bacterium]